MRTCLTADLHGNLPTIPGCDLLIVAGDVCPMADHTAVFQRSWLETNFSTWLKEVPAKVIVGIAGNHDFALRDRELGTSLPWIYLENSSVGLRSEIKIWGSPFAGEVGRGWAFMAKEHQLREMYEKIPEDTDIVVTHGPPHGICDWSDMGHENAGSPALREIIGADVKPALLVCGHIHESYGKEHLGERTLVVNASHMNLEYKPINAPILVDLEPDPDGRLSAIRGGTHANQRS